MQKSEASRHRTFGKEALAGAERNREGLQPGFVYLVVLQQGLDEVPASVILELRTVCCLELLDLGDDVAVDKDRRLPIQVDRPVRNNVLRGAIDPATRVVCDM